MARNTIDLREHDRIESGWVVLPSMASSVPLTLFADIQEPQSVKLSADGKWVAYSLKSSRTRAIKHVNSSLWIAEVGQIHSTKQLTRGSFNDHDPSFSPDGEHIAFLSDRAHQGKASDIYLLPRSGGEAFQLTPTDYAKAISSYKYNPDGTKIAYLKPREDSEDRKERLKDSDDATVYGETWDFQQIYVIDLESREIEVLDTVGHVSQLAWSPTGSEIAYVSHSKSDVDSVHLLSGRLSCINLKNGNEKSILSNLTTSQGLCWSEDGLRWIQKIDDNKVFSANAVFGVDAKENNKKVHLSQGKIDCAAELKNCSGKAVVHIVHGMTEQLQIVGSSSSLRRDRCRYRDWDVSINDGEATTVVVKSSTSAPFEIFSMVRGKECQLSHHGKELAELNLGTAEILEYVSEDGIPMDGFYAIPTSLERDFEARKPLPTVVIAHGGPYDSSNVEFIIDMFPPAFYTSMGYLVLVVNFRGGWGHGNDYSKVVSGNPAISYQDLVWLVKKGIEENHIDPARVAMTGWSYGGFLSYTSVTRDDDFHFAAAIPGAGVTDWTTMAMTCDIPSFAEAAGGKLPWLADAKRIDDQRSSPIYHMQNVKTPMLLLHGEADPRVPVSQSISWYRGMEARKLDCQLITYPREDHGWPGGIERAHYIDMMERTAKFLKDHLG